MEWKEAILSDVCDQIIDCVNKTAPVVDYQTNFKMIRTSNVKNGKIDIENVRFVTADTYKKWTRRIKPQRGDIFFTREAPLGEIGLLRSDENVFLGQRLMLYRSNPKVLNQLFLFYAFQSHFLQHQIRAHAMGSTVEHIRVPQAEKLKIKLPPLPTQQKIASILSAYDDLIENNQQRIAILEQMAQNIYQEWFVRFRFPGHAQSEFVEGLPKGWKKVSIGDAFEIVGGGTPSKENEKLWIDGNINWFTPSDITRSSNIFLESSSAKINNLGLANSSAKLFPPYSVMMTSRATIGKIGINTKTASTNQGFIICLPNNNFSYVYIYHWLKQNNKYIDLISSGATFKEIPKSLFKQLKIIKPGTEIMNNYTKISSAIFSLIENIYHKNNLLQQQRDKLLPRLLSGKLEV